MKIVNYIKTNMLTSGAFPLLYDNKEANHKQQLYMVMDGY